MPKRQTRKQDIRGDWREVGRRLLERYPLVSPSSGGGTYGYVALRWEVLEINVQTQEYRQRTEDSRPYYTDKGGLEVAALMAIATAALKQLGDYAKRVACWEALEVADHLEQKYADYPATVDHAQRLRKDYRWIQRYYDRDGYLLNRYLSFYCPKCGTQGGGKLTGDMLAAGSYVTGIACANEDCGAVWRVDLVEAGTERTGDEVAVGLAPPPRDCPDCGAALEHYPNGQQYCQDCGYHTDEDEE